MQQPVISVVIPVYNQEKYVGKCIRSVLVQTFQDFEVIIVNDGSTDKSLDICRKYAKKDSRISIIDKRNEGVSLARKDGFLKAQGEYISFLDSDDYLADNALEVLCTLAQEKLSDVVVGSYDIVYDNWGLLKREAVPYRFIDAEVPREQVLPAMIGINGLPEDLWAAHVWGCLYRRSCLMNAWEKSTFPMSPFYTQSGNIEDTAFNSAIAPFVESVWVSGTVVLHYRYGGVTDRDFPSIRKGASCFDARVESCFRYHCESVLPRILNSYSLLLRDDVVCQFHFGVSSESEIRRFILNEFAERKIVQWAQENASSLPDEMKRDSLVQSVVNRDADALLDAVKEREQFLKKHHYWKMWMIRHYQKIADRIGQMTEMLHK